MKGHIRERGKVWYAVLSVRDPATGRRKTKWRRLKAKGKRQAQVQCARLITELGTSGYAESDRVSVGQFLERWLDHIRTQVSPRTHEGYAEVVRKQLVPALGAVRLTKLQPGDISATYAKALTSGRADGKGGLSPMSVRHMHRILGAACKQAVRWGALVRNPVSLVSAPLVERKPMKTLDMDQTLKALEQLRATPLYIPALLGVFCGLRRGEICALRWDHVSGDNLLITQSVEQTATGIRYKPTKSGRGRNVRMPALVQQELKAWRLKQAQELLQLGIRPDRQTFVVTKPDGMSLWPRALSQQWSRELDRAGVSRLRFHDLRHSHATHLLSSGVHPKVAQERLGHSAISTTIDVYSHVMPEMQAEAVDRIDKALESASKRLAKRSRK